MKIPNNPLDLNASAGTHTVPQVVPPYDWRAMVAQVEQWKTQLEHPLTTYFKEKGVDVDKQVVILSNDLKPDPQPEGFPLFIRFSSAVPPGEIWVVANPMAFDAALARNFQGLSQYLARGLV